MGVVCTREQRILLLVWNSHHTVVGSDWGSHSCVEQHGAGGCGIPELDGSSDSVEADDRDGKIDGEEEGRSREKV